MHMLRVWHSTLRIRYINKQARAHATLCSFPTKSCSQFVLLVSIKMSKWMLKDLINLHCHWGQRELKLILVWLKEIMTNLLCPNRPRNWSSRNLIPFLFSFFCNEKCKRKLQILSSRWLSKKIFDLFKGISYHFYDIIHCKKAHTFLILIFLRIHLDVSKQLHWIIFSLSFSAFII